MVSISGSAHLQGRQWVDMSGWSEGSEDKGEVCVRCEGVGGLGWGPQESGHPISHVELDRSATNDATYIPHTKITNTCTMLVSEMQAQHAPSNTCKGTHTPTHTHTPHTPNTHAHTHTHR